jgi:hypothetical protein
MSNYTTTPTATTYPINSNFYGTNSNPFVGCGVYLMNSDLTGNNTVGTSPPFPVCCSINFLGRFGNINNEADAVIIYPGFKVICDENPLYDATHTTYTIDNTNGSKIIIRRFTNINTISGIKVYYLGNEIVLNGITNNVNPPTYP